MRKLFEQIYYNPRTICWGVGNGAVGPSLIARIQLRPLTKKQQADEKKAWDSAKEIYDKFLWKGQLWKPAGKTANKDMTCKITYINPATQTVCSVHILSQSQIKKGYRAGKSKISINAFITMHKNGEIEFYDMNDR